MMEREEDAVELAMAFHAAYERLAPNYGYKTREASAVAWDEVPAQNKALMIATAAAVLEEGIVGILPVCEGRVG